MNLRDRSFQEPKELGEVLDLVEKIVAVVTTPGDKLAGLTALLPDVVKAGDGYQAIGEEVKDEHVYEAAGAFSGRIAKALIVKKA
jgi:hypothetical protein